MAFTIGETVVYPHHGAAYIEDISTKKIRGEEKLYLTLRVMQGDLVIQVPADKVEDVGVRDVSNDKQLENVFNVLRAEHIEEPSNWSRRFKANSEKLTSGDVIKVAEVVRDLTRRVSDRAAYLLVTVSVPVVTLACQGGPHDPFTNGRKSAILNPLDIRVPGDDALNHRLTAHFKE